MFLISVLIRAISNTVIAGVKDNKRKVDIIKTLKFPCCMKKWEPCYGHLMKQIKVDPIVHQNPHLMKIIESDDILIQRLTEIESLALANIYIPSDNLNNSSTSQNDLSIDELMKQFEDIKTETKKHKKSKKKKEKKKRIN